MSHPRERVSLPRRRPLLTLGVEGEELGAAERVRIRFEVLAAVHNNQVGRVDHLTGQALTPRNQC